MLGALYPKPSLCTQPSLAMAYQPVAGDTTPTDFVDFSRVRSPSLTAPTGPLTAAEASQQFSVLEASTQSPAPLPIPAHLLTTITIIDGACKKFTIKASTDSTVAVLKLTVEKTTGVTVAQQRLICSGKLLANDDQTLASVGITAAKVLHLFPKPQIVAEPPVGAGGAASMAAVGSQESNEDTTATSARAHVPRILVADEQVSVLGATSGSINSRTREEQNEGGAQAMRWEPRD